MNPDISRLQIKLFSDGADIQSIVEMSADPLIKGFTTNPTLMRKAGVVDFEEFTRAVVRMVPNYPLSVECTSSEPFGQVSNGIKRGSGPSELKLRLQSGDAGGVVAR